MKRPATIVAVVLTAAACGSASGADPSGTDAPGAVAEPSTTFTLDDVDTQRVVPLSIAGPDDVIELLATSEFATSEIDVRFPAADLAGDPDAHPADETIDARIVKMPGHTHTTLSGPYGYVVEQHAVDTDTGTVTVQRVDVGDPDLLPPSAAEMLAATDRRWIQAPALYGTYSFADDLAVPLASLFPPGHDTSGFTFDVDGDTVTIAGLLHQDPSLPPDDIEVAVRFNGPTPAEVTVRIASDDGVSRLDLRYSNDPVDIPVPVSDPADPQTVVDTFLLYLAVARGQADTLLDATDVQSRLTDVATAMRGGDLLPLTDSDAILADLNNTPTGPPAPLTADAVANDAGVVSVRVIDDLTVGMAALDRDGACWMVVTNLAEAPESVQYGRSSDDTCEAPAAPLGVPDAWGPTP